MKQRMRLVHTVVETTNFFKIMIKVMKNNYAIAHRPLAISFPIHRKEENTRDLPTGSTKSRKKALSGAYFPKLLGVGQNFIPLVLCFLFQ